MKMNQVSGIALAALLCMGLATSALGQDVPWNGKWVDAAYAAAHPVESNGTNPVGDAPYAYGISDWGGYAVGPCDAYVRSGSAAVTNSGCVEIEAATDSDASVGFPLHLPSGVVLQYLRVYYYGNDAGLGISAGLWKTGSTGVDSLVTGASTTGTAGGATMQEFGPFSEVVNNAPSTGFSYNFLAILPRNGASVSGIYKVYVYYKRQISPAPGTATFSDVPLGAFGFQHIEALAASGITGGCGGGLFCPNNNVTRAEMAIFLAKALGLHYPF